MSGPKDYAVRFAIARLNRIRARMEAERMARAAVAQNMLSRQKNAAMTRMAATQSVRAAEIQGELEKRKEAASAARTQFTTKGAEAGPGPAMGMGATDGADVMDPGVNAKEEKLKSTVLENAASTQEDAATAELHSKLSQIQGWTEAMQADQTVKDFGAVKLAQWRNKAESVLADSSASPSAAEIQSRCDKILNEAQHIFDEAGELKGKFDTRNELLADIMASFKEIGFHVGDPFFEHPDDPTGPVILKATCGSETVTASIDLGTTVRSVWDGVESEQCKDAFFDYVDRMKKRGVDLEPERADLRERPKLIQKGANELPRTQSNTAGG